MEAEAAINAGMSADLMIDWFEPDQLYGNTDRILVLCPAARGRGGALAADMDELYPDGTFLGFGLSPMVPQVCSLLKNNRCSIHDSGFKPVVCRTAFGCGDNGVEKRDVVPWWDNDVGRAIVARWKETVKFKEPS